MPYDIIAARKAGLEDSRIKGEAATNEPRGTHHEPMNHCIVFRESSTS